jgi:tripartite-type tricarboxylate transporter receptor subunit TctC
VLADQIGKTHGPAVIVESRPGAAGTIAAEAVARAAPDGNTLLMIAKVFVVNPSVFKSVPYDPITSFAPIIKLATGSIVLAVHPSVPADTATGFIEYAKARPGQINYGSPGFATPHHLAMELFKQATGTDLVHVPYKGTSNVMSDLVGNHVGAMFIPTHVALPHAVEKQIKLLGVASLERVPAAPEVPTLDEQGVSGFEVDLWFGLLAPAGTPADSVNRYNTALNEFLRSPRMVAELAKQGLIASGGTPDVLRDLIAHDFAKWAKIIKNAGITAE